MSASNPTVTQDTTSWRPTPLFRLGGVYATPGALDLLRSNTLTPYAFLHRHQTGDWGELDAEDVEANRTALHHGTRLLSSYPIGNQRLWIITEADRSSTTLLLPEEY